MAAILVNSHLKEGALSLWGRHAEICSKIKDKLRTNSVADLEKNFFWLNFFALLHKTLFIEKYPLYLVLYETSTEDDKLCKCEDNFEYIVMFTDIPYWILIYSII